MLSCGCRRFLVHVEVMASFVFFVCQALRVFPAETRLTVYRRQRVLTDFRAKTKITSIVDNSFFKSRFFRAILTLDATFYLYAITLYRFLLSKDLQGELLHLTVSTFLLMAQSRCSVDLQS